MIKCEIANIKSFDVFIDKYKKVCAKVVYVIRDFDGTIYEVEIPKLFLNIISDNIPKIEINLALKTQMKDATLNDLPILEDDNNNLFYVTQVSDDEEALQYTE